MRIDWMALAEGIGADARNVPTLIGMNQNLFLTPSLPAATKRAILVHIVEADSLAEGANVLVSFTVEAPSGAVLAAQTAAVTAGKKRYEELPATIDIPAEFVVSATEYGEHRIRVQVQTPGEEPLTHEERLWVLAAEAPAVP